MAHLNDENCTRCAGYLLKQSQRDPTLWRKRFCMLAGDKLWFLKQRPQRNRGQLLPASSLVLVAARVQESGASIPFGFEVHTVDRVYFFRAFGRNAKRDQLLKVQRGWMQVSVYGAERFVLLSPPPPCSLSPLIFEFVVGRHWRRKF